MLHDESSTFGSGECEIDFACLYGDAMTRGLSINRIHKSADVRIESRNSAGVSAGIRLFA